MRRLLPVVFLTALVAGCAVPPPGAYIGGSAGAGPAVEIGRNASGETCTQQASPEGGADVFCGTWDQPSARVRPGPPTQGANSATMMALATDSTWRNGLNGRYDCASPTPTTVLGGEPAVAMQCIRKIGGFGQLALVATVNGQVYLADGIQPAFTVLEHSIGVLSGKLSPGAAVPSSAADALFARRLAAQAFSSGDIGQYEALMRAGARANLAESFGAAEQAYRAALAVQTKALGRDDPNQVNALASLAVQLSDEGRFSEAEALFAQASALAPRAADRLAVARVLHYRALDQINQNHNAAALALLQQATAAYAASLPKEALAAQPRRAGPALYASTGSAGLANMVGTDVFSTDVGERTALIGLVETHRYQAIVLRRLNRNADSEREIAAAEELAVGHNMSQPILTARLYRTDAAIEGARGQQDAALSGLLRSAADFNAALPGTRPIAQTDLLRVAELVAQKRSADALALCRQSVDLLRRLRSGVRSALLQPCLVAYFDQAAAQPAQAQTLYAEMFEASQLAQGNVTSQQIALATARLAENARDPKVGAAVRRRQDAGDSLATLLRARELLSQRRTADVVQPQIPPAELDRKIADAQTNLADADGALQAASPNYGQLVQQVVTAPDVMAALHPDETFAAITLGETQGWTFVLHDGKIGVAAVPLSDTAVARLVKRVRAGVEPTTNNLPRFDTAASQALYGALFGRLEPSMQGTKSLIVAPAGPLLSVPFGILLTGTGSPDDLGHAPWLLRRFAIAHVPAAANFVSLRKVAATSRATQPWFGFGDFRPVTLAQAEKSFPGGACADSAKLFAGLPTLPFAQRELDAARQLTGGTTADELVGPKFTAAAVRQAGLKNYRILHFAAHALLPSDLRCVDEPAIVTSDPAGATDARGALLTSSEVTGLDLDADAVILSACNSGGPGWRRQRRREPVGPGAQLLLCRGAGADGDALVGERPGGGVHRGRYAAAAACERARRDRGGFAECAVVDAG